MVLCFFFNVANFYPYRHEWVVTQIMEIRYGVVIPDVGFTVAKLGR